jgi:hypothetical protein
MKKKLIHIGNFEKPLLFDIPKNHEYIFMDMMDTNDYLQNNPLLFPKTKDKNYETIIQNKCKKIQRLLVEKYFVIDFSYIIFVLYFLYNNGGVFAEENFVFETTELPNNFVVFDPKEKTFEFSCIGFEKGNSFLLDVLYLYATQPTDHHKPMEEHFQEQLQRYILKTNSHYQYRHLSLWKYNESGNHLTGGIKIRMLHMTQYSKTKTIYDNNKIIAKNQTLKYNIQEKTFHKSRPKDIKIGITLDVPDTYANLFSNGINQNSLFFAELLFNCGFDVYFMTRYEKKKEEGILDKLLYDERFKTLPLKKALIQDIDIVFMFGYIICSNDINELRKFKKKVVAYLCGNEYLLDTEKILYSQHEDRNFKLDDESVYDAVWSIPQMYEMNKDYWEIRYRCPCLCIPFVWSPRVIYQLEKLHETCYEYKPNEKDFANLTIMEPNISVMKWALPAIMLAEEYCRNNSEKIGFLLITNLENKDNRSLNLFHKEAFDDFLKRLDLKKKDKIITAARFPTFYTLKKFDIDIVLSHQWGNPLNYLYLDLAWMGYPILHNAHLCKNVGYYYEGFYVKQGEKELEYIVKWHDKNLEDYKTYNRKVIYEYLPENKENQKNYTALIMNLLQKP